MPSLQSQEKWHQARIITISDVRIKERLVEINSNYGKVLKNKSKTTPAAEEERKKYLVEIEKTFDIKDPNARLAIINDLERTFEAQQEDLAFFDDYLGNY